MLSVVQVAFARFAKDDVVVAGIPISKGSVVMTHLPAANRDPRTTPGDEIDLRRASGSHLAFGYGFHRCVGAELARMELRMAFPMLARRFPDLRLAVPAADLAYRAQSIVYGVEALPVAPAARRTLRLSPPAPGRSPRSPAAWRPRSTPGRRAPRPSTGVEAAPASTVAAQADPGRLEQQVAGAAMSPPTTTIAGLSRFTMLARPQPEVQPGVLEAPAGRRRCPLRAAATTSSRSAPGSCPAIIARTVPGRGVGLQAAAAAAPAQRALVVEREVADLAGRAAGAVEELVVDDDARRRRRRRSSRRPSCRGRGRRPAGARRGRRGWRRSRRGRRCRTAARPRRGVSTPSQPGKIAEERTTSSVDRRGQAQADVARPSPCAGEHRLEHRRRPRPSASAWSWPGVEAAPLLGQQPCRSGRRWRPRRGCGRSRRRPPSPAPRASRTDGPAAAAARVRLDQRRLPASSRTMLETVAGASPVARASSAWVNAPLLPPGVEPRTRPAPAAGSRCAARWPSPGTACSAHVARRSWVNCGTTRV